ncbi:DUF2827 domain-containing protein [Burkholderia latens]|uniref:DUF2827 domain-containing protein n=1 Tax=Burkholderia latens TaxID=488446 RepID=UPI00158AA5D5|nr:DUF2827 domain-containing protein [Burkholderia latens]
MDDTKNVPRERRIGLRVGILIAAPVQGQSPWSHGVSQNGLFLAMLFARSPHVATVCLVSNSSVDDSWHLLEPRSIRFVGLNEAATCLDVVIELGCQLDREWGVVFRERGGKIVSMRVDYDYVSDIESMVFDLAPQDRQIEQAPYHEIWTLPQHVKTSVSYLNSVFRVPVRIMPHVWSPILLDQQAAALPEGRRFGYRPGRRRWRIGIFEPNECMAKTSFIPLLCCEAAHRADSGLLERVWAFNTFDLKEHAGFKSLLCSLDIVKHGLASFDQKFPFFDVMAADADAVVSHQWERAQNYLYYEALYGGYPLIHNSHLIGDCGYRYRAFDCVEGGRVLRRAFATHDANLDSYRKRASAFLRQLDPESEANVRAYGNALAALCGRL